MFKNLDELYHNIIIELEEKNIYLTNNYIKLLVASRMLGNYSMIHKTYFYEHNSSKYCSTLETLEKHYQRFINKIFKMEVSR